MADGLLLSPDFARRLTDMLRWFERLRGSLESALGRAAAPRGQILTPAGVRYGVLKTALTAGGSGTIYLRERNSADSNWETTTKEETVYAAGNWPDGFTVQPGTRVELAQCSDPRHPHLVAKDPTCSPAESVS